MTVAKKMELPVINEKDRMIDRATHYPQAVHNRAAKAAAVAIKNEYATHDGNFGVLDSYFNQLSESNEEFFPQGEKYNKSLLTFAFGDSDDGVIFELNVDKFLHRDKIELAKRLHAEVVHFNKPVKKKSLK